MQTAIQKPQGNHKPKIYTIYTHTKKESKHNTKDSHQITREQKKKWKKEKDIQKQIQNN